MTDTPTRLLVVDDEEDLELLIRQRFRRCIRKGEIDFVFARNGQEALSRLAENPDIRLVLSDINMPVMDGLTLLSQCAPVQGRSVRPLQSDRTAALPQGRQGNTNVATASTACSHSTSSSAGMVNMKKVASLKQRPSDDTSTCTLDAV